MDALRGSTRAAKTLALLLGAAALLAPSIGAAQTAGEPRMGGTLI